MEPVVITEVELYPPSPTLHEVKEEGSLVVFPLPILEFPSNTKREGNGVLRVGTDLSPLPPNPPTNLYPIKEENVMMRSSIA